MTQQHSLHLKVGTNVDTFLCLHSYPYHSPVAMVS